MSDTLVKVEGLSKKFCRNLKQSLWYGLIDLSSDLMLKRGTEGDHLRPNEFWAVKDIGFELKRGQCLGLIGRNGAGKTTLLKMLNGLIRPDKGSIKMAGRVGALIALGAGFNPILTGRENIFVNGAVLGLSQKEINGKLEQIVDFAELSDFIDAPVQSYSSGMQVRLGFAIASALEPDILLLDEVLAVGDVGFRQKCYNTIMDLAEKCAVILVSHSMPSIARVSSHIMLLKDGNIEYCGRDVAKGIEAYNALFSATEMLKIGGDSINLDRCCVYGKEKGNATIDYNDALTIGVDYTFQYDHCADYIFIGFTDQEAKLVADTSVRLPHEAKRGKKNQKISITIPKIEFAPGKYSVSIVFTKKERGHAKGKFMAQYRNVEIFDVTGPKRITSAPFMLQNKFSLEA